ncbi:MAG: VTT domain-containing protein [Dehalococcoidia bacterium]
MSQLQGREHVEDGDGLLESAADAIARRAESRFDRFVLRVTGWFAEHTTIRIVVAVTALLLALTPGIVLVLFPDLTDSLTGLSYGGVFLTNLASTATFYFPVPGLTLAAQTIIATEGDVSATPWLVGIAGGLGMALGEITAYYAGYLGAEIVRGREFHGPKRLQRTIERVLHGIGWLMDRWGMATLFVLSAIPNPLFEIAGLTAGSVRMSFRRFLVSVTTGKILRGMILAYYGVNAFDWFENLIPFR